MVFRRRILNVEARVGCKHSACQICGGQVALSLCCQHPLMIAPILSTGTQRHPTTPYPSLRSSDAGPHAVRAGHISCPINRLTLRLSVADVASRTAVQVAVCRRCYMFGVCVMFGGQGIETMWKEEVKAQLRVTGLGKTTENVRHVCGSRVEI